MNKVINYAKCESNGMEEWDVLGLDEIRTDFKVLRLVGGNLPAAILLSAIMEIDNWPENMKQQCRGVALVGGKWYVEVTPWGAPLDAYFEEAVSELKKVTKDWDFFEWGMAGGLLLARINHES